MQHSFFENPELYFKNDIPTGKIVWKSPSNIALVKYWGKRPVQLPMNPSVSFTLNNSVTETAVEYSPAKKGLNVTFYFEGKRNVSFEEKTKKFFENITNIFPFLNQLEFTIHSKNSFPHSAGIASSASGMSALALALCSIENDHFGTLNNENDFFRKASYVARLGSGSAARSVYGGVVIWGETSAVPGNSDLYGIPVTGNVHKDFLNYHDTILLVDSGQKKVSSRVGHSLMENNPYAKTRFKQASENSVKILDILKSGDKEDFIKIVESEALTLHAMMMTSNPYYLLMKPGTLNIIENIFEFRNETGIPLCFTLDAGPNVHLLYPDENSESVNNFINDRLKPYLSQNGFIKDNVGNGPERLI